MLNFSQEVRKQMYLKDLNKSQIARMSEISATYLHDLVKGKRRWNEETINKVCKALELKITIS